MAFLKVKDLSSDEMLISGREIMIISNQDPERRTVTLTDGSERVTAHSIKSLIQVLNEPVTKGNRADDLADTNDKGETFGEWLLAQMGREGAIADLVAAAQGRPEVSPSGSADDERNG